MSARALRGALDARNAAAMEPRAAFLQQAGYCEAMGAPNTARVCRTIAATLTDASTTGRRVLAWPGEPIADALPLRLVGGLHALAQAGDAALAEVFAGGGDAEAVIADALVRHDSALQPWLDGPPQTNEPGRAAALMTGLLEVARRHGPRLELLEIGSSAGLNLAIGRFRIDLGGVRVGPEDSPVRLAPEWRGATPPAVPVEIVSARGVDVAPVDISDPAQVARLRGYVWADAPERLARLDAAIALGPPAVEAGDAADWLEARLAEPQAAGVTRVLMHSVVWQYLPADSATRILAAMTAAGSRADAARPLAWVQMEPIRDAGRQEIRVQSWPGHAAWEIVGLTHAHGAWVEGQYRA